MTLAVEVVQAWRAAAKERLPEHVAQAARLHLLDAIGVGLAAAGSDVGQPYLRVAAQLAEGKASVFGRASGASAADAALVNGGLIHSLEYDDTHTASIVHGSSVVAATALAVAETSGASGAALLGAYARGWELLVRIGLAAPGGFQARGFQVTSVGGALAAALVAAELQDLDEQASVAALGISLSQAAGVLEFLSNGSSVKSLHPGWAAHAGVLAAMLARAGMTGPETSFEGRFGLFRQFVGSEGSEGAATAFSAQLESFGKTWHLPDAAFKFYPCCHYLHPFIEAAGVLAERGVRADSAERILCRVPAGAAPVICEPWEVKQAPQTPHAARWSLPIVVAARIAEGRVGLETFERPISQAALELARRIEWEPLAGARFPERFEAEITCGAHCVRIDDVFGNASRPPGREDVLAKFQGNARRSLSGEAAEALARALEAGAPAAELGAQLKRNAKRIS